MVMAYRIVWVEIGTPHLYEGNWMNLMMVTGYSGIGDWVVCSCIVSSTGRILHYMDSIVWEMVRHMAHKFV